MAGDRGGYRKECEDCWDDEGRLPNSNMLPLLCRLLLSEDELLWYSNWGVLLAREWFLEEGDGYRYGIPIWIAEDTEADDDWLGEPWTEDNNGVHSDAGGIFMDTLASLLQIGQNVLQLVSQESTQNAWNSAIK